MSYIHIGNPKKTIVGTLLLIVMIMVFVSCDKVLTKEEVKVQDTAFSMGTAITSTLYGRNSDELEKNLQSVNQCLTDVDLDISWRNEGSLVSIFNEKHSVDVSSRESVFETALDIAGKSGGAFDPTVLSVSELWNIGSEEQRHPADSEIETALSKVDYTSLHLEDGILSSDNSDILLELGAIGKGYALNEAYKVIDRDEVSSGILSAGSSILTFGTKPDGSKFKVGLRNPRGEQDDLIGIFELTDLSVSTSGDYEKYFEEDGKRYHHILDARTGYPADSGLMSVTVIGEDSTLCDALSTVGFILGLDEGMELLNNYNVMAIFVDNQKNVYYNDKSILNFLSFEGESEGYILMPYEG
ncbi:FAD:protein FMN transferase [Frisingicoccus sp.]|uniref:FAD:protein FMN transferase n=1 Tax=Frisingicoccus sp. TaxID=1918627 RepID=UPI003868914D